MGQIRQLQGTTACQLQAEHLIGRGPQCALRIDQGYVSAQHALVRWNGMRWQLIDRASRNGTWLGAQRLEAGREYDLDLGASFALGRSSEIWTLDDASPPQVMVTRLSSGQSHVAADGSITLPSEDGTTAVCVIHRVKDGLWQLDHPERPSRFLDDAQVFEVGGAVYRFSCPQALGATIAESVDEKAVIVFRVSSDEEFIELSLRYPSRTLPLGSRSHNYLLLVLARARLADLAAGLDEASSGWLYKNELADALGTTPQQVDGEVFRSRANFAQHSAESARIIERRPRTTQLRLGFSEIEILGV